jgi:hypothetical protein
MASLFKFVRISVVCIFNVFDWFPKNLWIWIATKMATDANFSNGCRFVFA